MGVRFFQNGSDIGISAGWGGFTGNNNYVVRYDFTTGNQGASQVAIVLSNIFYGHNATTQSFGFRISADPVQWCNARGFAPDSNTATMSYSSSTGYGCTLWAQGLNLLPNTIYYIFVYVTSGGGEYYTGWNCVSPQIAAGGSYSAGASEISSLSASVTTGGNVSLIMARSGSNYHRATFRYGDDILAVSGSFPVSLSYACPRSWLNADTSARSISVSVSVQSYSDSACTLAVGSPVTGSFTLTADKDMKAVFTTGAITVVPVNSNGQMSHFVSGLSKAQVVFDPTLIDMSACAGAEISRYTISCASGEKTGTSPTLVSDVLTSDTEIVCTVTDSRGFESSSDVEISLLPYVAPSLTGIAAVRCGSTGVEDESGMYYKLKFSVACSSLSGNACVVGVSIKPSGGSFGAETLLGGYENGVWSDEWASPVILGGNLTGDGYVLRFTVSDLMGGSGTYTLSLHRLRWAMKFNSTGTAIGFGMEPTADEALQIPEHWKACCGTPVLSSACYGTAAPGSAVASPVEGQIYLRIST